MASATFEPGERVTYLFDEDIPLGYAHLNNKTGTVKRIEDGLVHVHFDFYPSVSTLACEPAELIKEDK